jgi:S1-C subfamily serine protease
LYIILGGGILLVVVILAALFTPTRGELEPLDLIVRNRPGSGWVYSPWLDVAVQPSKGEVKGVIVTQTGEMADEQGIKRGDVIKKVNQSKTTSTKEFQQAVNNGDRRRGILLDIVRDGRPYFLTVGTQQMAEPFEDLAQPATTGTSFPPTLTGAGVTTATP